MPKGIKGFTKGNVEAKKKEVNVMASRMREKLASFVEDNFSPLLLAKKDLALGHYVMIARKFESHKVGKGKNQKWIKKRTGPFYVIENEAEARTLLVNAQPEEGQGDDYYKIVLQKPDNQAQNYLIDQAIGKAKETIENETPTVNLIDKAVIFQIDKIYGKKQITNGKYEGNGSATSHS